MEVFMQSLLGKLGRQCYAVLCLGVIIVSVTIAHYVYDLELPNDPKERTKRRLHALHGPSVHPSNE